jgi:crotonyl-CoA reductase
VVVRAEDADMFAGMPSRDKDPRKSLLVQEVPTPSWARARRSSR